MDTLHFADLISAQAKRYGDRAAIYHRRNTHDQWESLSWNSFSEQVLAVAKALLGAGINEGDRVGQFSNNMAENMVVDYALFANRAIVVPMYATSTVPQVAFIVDDAEIAIMFVGDAVQYAVAMEVKRTSSFLKRIIVFDHEVVLEDADCMYFSDFLEQGRGSTKHFEIHTRQHEATEDDLACILYTSGTTGNPKGVMLPHSCLNEAVRVHRIRIPQMTDKEVSVSFLPMSHVFERMWCYLCIANGLSIYVNLRPIEITETISQVRPTMMCAVPRFWEKVYSVVQETIMSMSPFKQGLVSWALATGKKYNIDYLRLGLKPSLGLSIKYLIADRLIFSKVKKKIGIERAILFPVAGAKLADEINIFFRSMGVPLVYGYGLTETTASVSFFDDIGYEFGTVGKIVPDLQVKIGPDNEILVKGRTVFKGYYRRPEANAEAFTEDGFFRTGDAGFVRNDAIILTDRIKDLFKTSYGKYIAPQEIETRLVLDKYIEQVAVIGDERPYVTALIAPSVVALEAYAKEHQLQYASVDELLMRKEIQELIEKCIQERQSGMAPYEVVKKFRLLSQPFSIQSGELTNTLKLKRPIVLQRYKVLIDEMYAS